MKPCYLIAVFVCILLCPAAQSQAPKNFPTDEEIRLVMTQTDRALVDYAATVQQERKLYGDRVDVKNDSQVIDGLTTFSKGMGAQPQRFNSPFGFEFVLLLDDASRNAALCNAGAISEGVKATMAGQTQAAQDYMELGQSCTSVSTLLYTVSESAAALYQRYVNGEEELAQRAVEEMEKCVAVLKNQKKQ
jgi:hypothetical protein